mmetsp:Transcript_8634/g.30628  ORF Transcript_8634/g.30628 Transcript_8634/m.30628 type:complete len:235 (+) Transcript_8634:4223-4927(+)
MLTHVAATSTTPNRQVRRDERRKFVPETTTGVPPRTEPVAGVMSRTVAKAVYVNVTPSEEASTPLLVTSSACGPGAAVFGSAGVVHCSDDDDRYVAVASTVPPSARMTRHASVAPSTKPEPDTNSTVPPDSGPMSGDTRSTSGDDTYSNQVATPTSSTASPQRSARRTGPAACAGVVHSSVPTTDPGTAGTAESAPKMHSAPAVGRFSPVMTTTVPPSIGPVRGSAAEISGRAT